MKFQGFEEEDVVISGIGCKLPQVDNLSEFAEKLFAGLNLVTKDDPKQSSVFSEDVPSFSGKIKSKNFDSLFFSISNAVSIDMDPITKHILERTFEAVLDAGLNPAEIKGTNTCVYTGTSHSDFDLLWLAGTKSGYSIMGKNRCMNANRTSWWLDVKGTSVAMDGSWANGVLNLVRGWEAIKKGRCDIAVVSSGSLQDLPENNIQFDHFKKFSRDGACKSYDDSANGWCRGEAVVVFVLQRASIAKRCYGIIDDAFFKYYGGNSDLLKEPSQETWEKMFHEFYDRSKIDVNDICYIEGQGTGIKEEDASELNAINSVFCKNRTTPLLIGSVKSNIGHTEAASAACSIIKAVLCLEKGIIPKTLHYNSPNKKCDGLTAEKIRVVDKNTPLPPNGRIAVNAQGFTNVYGHVVLRPNPKTNKITYDDIPRLVFLSARTDDAMDELLEKIENSPIDVEQISLLHDVFTQKIDKYLSRGYTIVPKVNDESAREHQVFDPVKRPIWFIFSGMGSQWPKMGKRLMDLPLFRESIERSHEVLKKKGLDLIEIITTDNPKIFDNILHSFVGIAAIQIALVDLLNALGIVPDKIIGHSVGELGCSYADGCLTAEQTILCAYSRGKASIETPLTKGFMAAIGKGYNEIKDELPEGVEVACRNASDSCTISGPAQLVQDFVKDLQDRKVFARTVNVSNIAYHSQYIKPAAPKLLEYLQDVIPEPILRSQKWISTSILEENWDTDLAKYCSAEYHTNNLLSSVFFEEGSRKIPNNAICIEIAPHGLLQAILKRSLGKECLNIPLTNRTAKDPLYFLLSSIGKMYMAGLEPAIKNIYPKVEYPVSRGTGSLNHLVQWQHAVQNNATFHTYYYKQIKYFLKERFSKTVKDDIGYLINQNNYYPIFVYLDQVWSAFASYNRMKKAECSVLFRDVRLQNPMVIQDLESDSAFFSVGLGTGKFEIYTNEKLIINGFISLIDKKPQEIKIPETNQNNLDLRDEIYTDFMRKGCRIGDNLRCLESVESNKNSWKCKIGDSCDWLQTIESMVQLAMIDRGRDSRSVLFPLAIERLSIIPALHSEYKNLVKGSKFMDIEYDSTLNIIKCGGIQMKGIKLREVTKSASNLIFESIKFVPFKNSLRWELDEMIDYCYGIISDNRNASDINISQITNGIRSPAIASYLEKKFQPLKVKVISDGIINNASKKSHFVICDGSSLREALRIIDERGFILVKFSGNLNQTLPDHMDVITSFSTKNDEFVLLTKKQVLNDEVDYITIPNNETMLNNIVKGLEKTKKITYLIDYKEPDESFENLKKNLQAETTSCLRWLLILDEQAPKFDPKNPFYADQLQKGLATNIYYRGLWGSFYRRTFTEKNCDVQSALRNNERELTVSYVGMTFDDNLVPKQQIEYSGVLNDNTRVMGIAEVRKDKLLSVDKHLQWKLPSTWNLEDAATVPMSYALAYYCIKIVAFWIRRGRVLVTDGLSCNGRAAISVAHSFGFRVYVTVNNDEEIATVQKLFPYVNKEDIINHEDNDFDIPLGFMTNGTYFDIIMNNVEKEKLVPAIACIGSYGVLFHFGKEDLKKNVQMGTHTFLTHAAFYGITPDLLQRLTVTEKEEIYNYVSSGIENEHIKPLPRALYTAKDIEKISDEKEIFQNRTRILFTNDNFQLNPSKLKIDPESSYIIIGDETDFWIDIAEWLITRNVSNIIVSQKRTSKDILSRMQNITNIEKITIVNESDVSVLLSSAKKLAPVAAVFVIKMTDQSDLKSLTELDKLYRDKNAHLIVLSKKEDLMSEICIKRTVRGYYSTNFIWKTEERLTNENLAMLEKFSGQDTVIQVGNNNRILQNSDRMLADILPSSIEEFCELGSSLNDSVRLVELPSLGQKVTEIKEVTPLFVIPGLKDDTESILMPLAKKIIYPVILVKLPRKGKEVTIEELASLVLPKIQSFNNSGRVYNLLGVSWGSYVAIELTRQLEKLGANVSLSLIDGPLKTLKEMLVAKKSLECDIVNILQGISNNILSNSSSQASFASQVDQILTQLGIPQTKVKHIKDAVVYSYQNLKAMLDYDYNKSTFKGPITILKSDEFFGDISIKKICNNVSIRNVALDQKSYHNSNEFVNLINGSVIMPSMNEDFINECTYKGFDEFLLNAKQETIENDIFIEELKRTGRDIYFPK